jgi:Phytanoyl-CoA dioxygenase (PhyH)
LNECKGWRSRPTLKDWHGWHGDSWYDQVTIRDSIPREIKLGVYLTDVSSGGLAYVKGSHRRLVPALHPRKQAKQAWEESGITVNGPAGTVVLFDTSGVHRQSCPILQIRHALFYCYHDPSIPLQAEDVAYNRYHPLQLNAAFLGGLSAEQQRILGFGDKRQFVRGYRREISHRKLHAIFSALLESSIWLNQVSEPLIRRVKAIRSRLLPN